MSDGFIHEATPQCKKFTCDLYLSVIVNCILSWKRNCCRYRPDSVELKVCWKRRRGTRQSRPWVDRRGGHYDPRLLTCSSDLVNALEGHS